MSDSATDAASCVSTDGRVPGPFPTAKERSVTGKKKKKQATHVRMQQPFWAALASTKVTVLKEYEPAQGHVDAEEAEAVGTSNMGNVDFKIRQNRVWITEIGATDISFGVCLPSNVAGVEDDDYSGDAHARAWHVRVNGASWISTKSRLAEQVVVGTEVVDVWEGRIYGLTALSSYHCEFVRGEDVIYDTSIITQSAPSTESGKSSSV
jgi:hypothetical protein